MTSLLDSGKVIAAGGSLKKSMRECAGLSSAPSLSLRTFLLLPQCPLPACITVHLKVLTEPTLPIAMMLQSMRKVYKTAGIRVEVGSRENLTGGVFTTLNDLDVGDCIEGEPTFEQALLFANRKHVGDNEIVAYFVHSTVPAFNGCAVHPDDEPGAAIASIASQWTLAHETGHVLGLQHISGEGDNCETPDFTRLMTGCGTSNIVGTPKLSHDEKNIMNGSDLTHWC